MLLAGARPAWELFVSAAHHSSWVRLAGAARWWPLACTARWSNKVWLPPDSFCRNYLIPMIRPMCVFRIGVPVLPGFHLDLFVGTPCSCDEAKLCQR
eukprot:scaffold36097_cov20-Tisochrysis_lutea.AAC.6